METFTNIYNMVPKRLLYAGKSLLKVQNVDEQHQNIYWTQQHLDNV